MKRCAFLLNLAALIAFAMNSASAKTESLVVGGGCFWCTEAAYELLPGVKDVVSGYAGGKEPNPTYEQVCAHATGHAEVIKIDFDPAIVSLEKLLDYFWHVHNPTQVGGQGNDHGPQYRSTIFPADATQREIATKYIAQLDAAHVFPAKIVTTLEDGKTFYPAEAYHQDFLVRNPDYPYIVINDIPKVRNLSQMFPDIYRTEPVLVTPRAATARRGG